MQRSIVDAGNLLLRPARPRHGLSYRIIEDAAGWRSCGHGDCRLNSSIGTTSNGAGDSFEGEHGFHGCHLDDDT